MNTNPTEYYDLLARAFGGDTSSRRLQAFLDTVVAEKYNGLDLRGFSWSPDMQLDYTYEQLQKEYGITAMANYYDDDSPAIPRDVEGASLVTGKIPRMKDVIYFNEDKVRKQLILERMFGADSAEAVDSAKLKLFETVDDLIGGHTNSLTYQRHQMVSAGKLSLTPSNNPKGISGVTFPAGIPADNKTKVSVWRGSNAYEWWTDKGEYKTEGASADVIGDIQAWLEPILDKGIHGHLEVNATFFRKILRHSSVLKAIALNLWPMAETVATNAAAVLQEEQRKAVFSDLVGVPVVAIDARAAASRYNKNAKKTEKVTIDSFEKDVIVFVPDGNIGEVLTVMPVTFQSASATYGSFYGGRLLLTVEADAVKKCQGFYTEMTSLVVPECPQQMFYLYPNE